MKKGDLKYNNNNSNNDDDDDDDNKRELGLERR